MSFQNYVDGLHDGGRTEADVCAVMRRIGELTLRPENDNRIPGLVVGRVQSGKTRNYIGLILKAMEDGWNTFIILTSNNTSLARQTRYRINQAFVDCQVAGPVEVNFLVGQNHYQDPNNLAHAMYWGVAQKEVNHLRRVETWLRDCRTHRRLEQMRLMIIDDEADNASQNGHAGGGGEDYLSNAQVDELKDSLREANHPRLADWIDAFRNRDLRQHEDGIKDNLQNVTRVTFDVLLGEPFAGALGIDAELKNEIRQYFNAETGNRSYKRFLHLLRTLLEVPSTSVINGYLRSFSMRPGENGEGYYYPFDKLSYIGYTATPFANLLNEGFDTTPLFPKFVYSLANSARYLGLNAIFGEAVNDPNTNLPIVRQIPTSMPGEPEEEGEVALILRRIQNGQNPQIDDDLCADRPERVEWTTLKTAIKWFICTAAVRRWSRLRMANQPPADEDHRWNMAKRWSTMFLNIHVTREVHRQNADCIQRYLSRVAQPENLEAFVEECHRCWDEIRQEFSREQLGAAMPDYGEIRDYPVWTDIKAHVRYFLRDCQPLYRNGFGGHLHVIVINSDQNGRSSKNWYFQEVERPGERLVADYRETGDDHAWIICGGNTIGRGLTLEGLTVSYIDRLRGTTAVDTLTQQGRWFGYRDGYELLPRIWMTGAAVRNFKETCIIENRLHESIRENFEAGYDPSDNEHFQTVWYLGRRLSGRQNALEELAGGVGVEGVTDHVSSAEVDKTAIFDRTCGFIQGFGDPITRDDQYFKPNVPYWRNVERNDVLAYLREVCDHYPEQSRAKLRALIADIEQVDVSWDIVIGVPERGQGRDCWVTQNITVPGHEPGFIPTGCPHVLPDANGVCRYAGIRSRVSFGAMLTHAQVNHTDFEVLQDNVVAIARNIDHAGGIGEDLAAVLNWDGQQHGDATLARLTAYVDHFQGEVNHEVAPALRNYFTGRIPNRDSSSEWMMRAYRHSLQNNPVLQFYFVEPYGENAEPYIPYVGISFLWQGHDPEGYILVRAGIEDRVEHDQEFLRFIPGDEREFKRQLLITRRALLTAEFEDGGLRHRVWHADNFGENSPLRNNVESHQWYIAAGRDGARRITCRIITQEEANQYDRAERAAPRQGNHNHPPANGGGFVVSYNGDVENVGSMIDVACWVVQQYVGHNPAADVETVRGVFRPKYMFKSFANAQQETNWQRKYPRRPITCANNEQLVVNRNWNNRPNDSWPQFVDSAREQGFDIRRI